MIIWEELHVKTPEREILIDISDKIKTVLRKSDIKEGACKIFVPHTTAAITINENADPNVLKDIITYLNRLIPKKSGLGYIFRHGEGNSDAHIKSSLIGPSLEILIHEGKLMLGTWQGIMFAEFDGPRPRKVLVQIQGE